MAKVFVRGEVLYLDYFDADGKRKQPTTGYRVGQEALAEEALKIVLAGVERERKSPSPAKRLTVAEYFDRYYAPKRKDNETAADEETRLRLHAFPSIGHMPIVDVTAAHINKLINETLATEIKNGVLAPRTVRDVYFLLAVMFKHAVRDDAITATPCLLGKRELPDLVDKDSSWRIGAVFERNEVELLISDPRVPQVRRVFYAVVFLTGARFGEVAALRWSDFVPREPLASMRITKSRSTKKQKVKATKTDESREAPVHPVLAEILKDWHDGGWEAEFRRKPKPDDLVLPYPLSRGKGRRVGGPTVFWRSDRLRELLILDCKTLGLRPRTTHDGRATFITMAEEVGCGSLIHNVTHKPPKSARTGYVRRPPWGPMCVEVMKIPVRLSHCDSACDTSASVENPERKDWSRRELNPRPKGDPSKPLRV